MGKPFHSSGRRLSSLPTIIPFFKTLPGRFGQFPFLSPFVEAVVQERPGEPPDGPTGHFAEEIVPACPGQDPSCPFHTLSLGRWQMAFLGYHLTPSVELFVNIDLYRAYIGAGPAERGGEGQSTVLF